MKNDDFYDKSDGSRWDDYDFTKKKIQDFTPEELKAELQRKESEAENERRRREANAPILAKIEQLGAELLELKKQLK
jgi:hypothetical protein